MSTDTTEIDGRIQALIQQRDEAMNRVVLQAGLINRLQQELTAQKTASKEGAPPASTD